MPFLHNFPKIAAGVILSLALGACSWMPGFLTEYKIDIQQGNVLTQAMVSQLKPGLSRDQVRFILGTPVLMDMFHGKRWDYVYRLLKGATGEVTERQFSVFFDDNDRLVRVAGDVEDLRLSDPDGEPESRMREIDLGSIPEGTEAPPLEEGFFGKMIEKLGF